MISFEKIKFLLLSVLQNEKCVLGKINDQLVIFHNLAILRKRGATRKEMAGYVS